MWIQPAISEGVSLDPKLRLVRRFHHRGAFVRKLHDDRLLFRGACWYFWDVARNAVETSWGASLAARYAEDGSPDGRRLAYMVEEGVVLYDFSREGSIGRYDCEADESSICRFSPDGKLLWFAYADRLGVVVVDTEEVHVEKTSGGTVDLIEAHPGSPSALLSISGGPYPSALAMFDGNELRITPSHLLGSVSSFSPLGKECVVEHEDGYRFVAFPAGFAADIDPRRLVESPAHFDRGRRHSATYLTDRLLLELSMDVDEIFDLYGRTASPRVAILDRASCTRSAAVRFTKGAAAPIVPFGEDRPGEACAIDSIDALGRGLILTYDECCGHRVWDASALCSIDA